MPQEKYGFIYIWRDRKHNRYYVGRHWGTEDDGYLCSSRSMRDANRYRPQDFKRRIIAKVFTNKQDLVLEEQRWLDMIKSSELGTRYYNKTLRSDSPSMFGRTHTQETKNKMSIATKGKPKSESHKISLQLANIGKTYTDETNAKKGRPFSEERKRQQSEKLKAYYANNKRSTETRQKISENTKRLQKEKKIGMHGKSHSEETINKMRNNWNNQFTKTRSITNNGI